MAEGDATRAAAAALVEDMLGDPAAAAGSQQPVSADPAEVTAHEVGDLMGDYSGLKTTAAEGWRTVEDEINIYQRATSNFRPHNSPEARRARLFPSRPTPASEPPAAVKPKPSFAEWADDLTPEQRDRVRQRLDEAEMRQWAADVPAEDALPGEGEAS
jgi:hypothetical protein